MSSYYSRRFYRRLYQFLFLFVCFFKPLIGAIGQGLFAFSLYQIAAVAPLTLTPHFHSFYYSQSSTRVEYHINEKEKGSFIVDVTHGPILPDNPEQPRPWYQRLGFIQYHLRPDQYPEALKTFSGQYCSGHYYDYSVFIDKNHYIDISGETHPLTYKQAVRLQGTWKRPSEIFPVTVEDFVFSYDDPVTWARIRIPNIYFKAQKVQWDKIVLMRQVEGRLKSEKPRVKTSVYGMISINDLRHPNIKIKMLNADLTLLEGQTHYLQDLFSQVVSLGHNLETVTAGKDDYIDADWVIEIMEELYPKMTFLSADGVLEHHFDFQLDQNKHVGLELLLSGKPQELESLMDFLSWVKWDPEMRSELNQYSQKADVDVSIVWNPAEQPSVEIFAIDPTEPMPDEDLNPQEVTREALS